MCSNCREEFICEELSAENKIVLFKKSIFVEELLERFLKLGDYALVGVFSELIAEIYSFDKLLYIETEKINDDLGYNPELEVLKQAGLEVAHVTKMDEVAYLNIFTIVEWEKEREQEFIGKYCIKSVEEIYFTALFGK